MQVKVMSTMGINRRMGLISTFLETLPFTSRIKTNFTIHLIVEGNLLKEDGTRYAGADAIALANNDVMHLFSNVKYELAGQVIECQQSRDCWCFNGYRNISLRLRVWNWTYPILVTRNIGWSVDGKRIR